jgi:hypothetical protein
MDHSPYTPDLAPSDFQLFLHLKKHLAGKTFDDDDEVQEEVMMWFKGQAADFYDTHTKFYKIDATQTKFYKIDATHTIRHNKFVVNILEGAISGLKAVGRPRRQ